jgi:16S rRNA pseudouridine516 synthase
MRLDKFICKSTQLSKAEARAEISVGAIRRNGVVLNNADTQIHHDNIVTLHDDILTLRPFNYVLIHKPKNTICSNIDEKYPSLLNNIQRHFDDELHIAGRLDADTTGLVLATDDGRWSFDITRPEKQCKKVYHAQLSRPIASSAISEFSDGILLQGEKNVTLPAKLEILSPQNVRLTITEGKYHQVKRMFAAVGNRVTALHRERVGDVTLNIEVGKWRQLTSQEVLSFR